MKEKKIIAWLIKVIYHKKVYATKYLSANIFENNENIVIS